MKSLRSPGAELDRRLSDQPPLLTYLIAALFQIVRVSHRTRLIISCSPVCSSGRLAFRAFWDSRDCRRLILILPCPICKERPAYRSWSDRKADKKKLWLVLGLRCLHHDCCLLAAGPLFVAGLIAQEWQGFRKRGSWSKFLAPCVLWTGGFGITALLIGLISIYPDGLSQLTLTHWTAQSTEFSDPTTIAGYLSESLPAIFLAVIGSVYVIQRGRPTGLYLTGWALAGFLLLSQYSPIWYHHQLLVTIPVAILAGVAIGEFVVGIRDRFRKLRPVSVGAAMHVAVAVLIPYFVASGLSNSIRELDYRLPNLRPPPADSREIEAVGMLDVMREYADATNYILTDRPMFAIWLGKPVPPEVAALTGKRLLTGELSQIEIISAIVEYQPEQVVCGRTSASQRTCSNTTDWSITLRTTPM
jgi:hypothetical protein